MKTSLFSLLLILLASCASRPASTTLYSELGGQDTIDRIVAAVVVSVQNNPDINFLFEDTDFDYFADKLRLQLCELADGPCVYDGLSMQDAHLSLAITEAEFNHFTQDLIDIMNDLEITISAQNDLLSRLVPMHPDIIDQ